MFAKTLMVGTAVATVLLAFELCAPALTGATAHAQQRSSNSGKSFTTTTTRKITTTTTRVGNSIKNTTTTTIQKFKGNTGTFVNRSNTGTTTLNKNNTGFGLYDRQVLEVLRKILPPVRGPHKPHGDFPPRCGRPEAHGDSVAFGEEHWKALIVADPPRVSITAIRQMRREQNEQPVV